MKFSDLFTSPREREGKKLQGGQMATYDNIMSGIEGMSSAMNGINTADDVSRRFGLPAFDAKGYKDQVDATYAPARGSLATRFAKMRKSAGQRMGSGAAMPGLTFSSIDGAEGSAFGDLEAGAAREKMGAYDRETAAGNFRAQLLASILGNQDQYGLSKMGLKLNTAGAKSNAISNYLQTLSADSTFDDILGLTGTAAVGAGALGWKPLAPAP